MRTVDNVLFYADPPYLMNTNRVTANAYTHEVDEEYHERLYHALSGVVGYVVVSGYASELYKSLYENSGWHRVDRESRINNGGTKTESLWISPQTWNALNMPVQATMFGGRP